MNVYNLLTILKILHFQPVKLHLSTFNNVDNFSEALANPRSRHYSTVQFVLGTVQNELEP